MLGKSLASASEGRLIVARRFQRREWLRYVEPHRVGMPEIDSECLATWVAGVNDFSRPSEDVAQIR
jgi:hypothetical protein